eukprot:UN01393
MLFLYDLLRTFLYLGSQVLWLPLLKTNSSCRHFQRSLGLLCVASHSLDHHELFDLCPSHFLGFSTRLLWRSWPCSCLWSFYLYRYR